MRSVYPSGQPRPEQFKEKELVYTQSTVMPLDGDEAHLSLEGSEHPLSSTAQLGVEILKQATSSDVAELPALSNGRALEIHATDSTDKKVIVSIRSRVLMMLKNFFNKLLALFYANPSWRNYEKYHYLSEQTFKGIERILQDSSTPLNEAERLLMYRWVQEAKSGEGAPKKLSDSASVQDRARFYLQSALVALVQASEAKKDDKVDCRKCHKVFLENLRQVLELNADGNQSGAEFTFANEICFSMYTQCNMTEFSKSLIDFVTGEPDESALSSQMPVSSVSEVHADEARFDDGDVQESMATGIEVENKEVSLSVLDAHLHEVQSLHEKVKHAANARKIGVLTKIGQSVRGELSFLGFDPNLQGNPPYRKFDVQATSGMTIGNLRLPTPTIGSRINPEFLGYLHALRSRGMKHTYINLQNNRGRDGEGIRSRLLQQLGNDFADVLTVVTIDKNSDFYFQKNSYAEASMDADIFTAQLQARILNEKVDEVPTGCYLPEALRNDLQFKLVLKDIVDGVHAHFFGKRNKLTREERKNFIEIVYTLAIDAIIKKTGANFYNNSCKDCIDRGGGANALMYYTLSMLSRDQMSEADQQISDALLASMTYSDALWARKREIIEERLDRAVDAAHAMLSAQSGALDDQRQGKDLPKSMTPFAWLRSQMYFRSTSISEDTYQGIGA